MLLMKVFFSCGDPLYTQEEGLAGGSEWFLNSNVMDTFHAKFHAFTS